VAITFTPRLNLHQWGLGTDPFSRAHMNAAFLDLENKAGIILQGTFAARPAFGVQRRLYRATDQSRLYYDDGAAWTEVLTPAGADLLYPRRDTLTADEDIYVRKAGVVTRLAKGADGQALMVSGGALAYAYPNPNALRVIKYLGPDSFMPDGATRTVINAGASNASGVMQLADAVTDGIVAFLHNSKNLGILTPQLFARVFFASGGAGGGNWRVRFNYSSIRVSLSELHDQAGTTITRTIAATGGASVTGYSDFDMTPSLGTMNDTAGGAPGILRLTFHRLGADALDTNVNALRVLGIAIIAEIGAE
jgi:hypothetical protein